MLSGYYNHAVMNNIECKQFEYLKAISACAFNNTLYNIYNIGHYIIHVYKIPYANKNNLIF